MKRSGIILLGGDEEETKFSDLGKNIYSRTCLNLLFVRIWVYWMFKLLNSIRYELYKSNSIVPKYQKFKLFQAKE